MKLLPLVLTLLLALSLHAESNNSTPTPSPSVSADSTLTESLTPPVPETPQINGPSVFGVRPGSPVLYNIPASGVRPMSFSAEGLPP
jgi:hypothetical protein